MNRRWCYRRLRCEKKQKSFRSHGSFYTLLSQPMFAHPSLEMLFPQFSLAMASPCPGLLQLSVLGLQPASSFSSHSLLPLPSTWMVMGQIRDLFLVVSMDVGKWRRQSTDRRAGRPAAILKGGLYGGKRFSLKQLVSSPRPLAELADCCPQQLSKAVSTLAICLKAVVQFGGKSCHCLHLPGGVSVLRVVLMHTN